MLFNSLAYLIFFPIVAVCFFVFPKKYRWLWLLLCSFYFYMSWNVRYAGLMLLSIVITYTSGILLGRVNSGTADAKHKNVHRKLIVAGSFITNLGILFFFKYFNFVNSLLAGISASFSAEWPVSDLNVLLPVGISFYTFQALSYTIDVYYDRVKPETHFGYYALFVSFFPQLVAGPIERTGRLLPQIKATPAFDSDRMRSGLASMWLGYFKKVVIADRVAVLVNTVYNDPGSYKGMPLIIATLFFSIQIYCDFSGYSDIAIGSAKILGFNLMTNFDAPYFSKSISEFWRRWHISLSQWFRDCLYIPLGGSRVSKPRKYFNVFVVFLTSGLWHGASLNFIVWGALHGAYQIAGEILKPWRDRLLGFFRINGETFVRAFIQILMTYTFTCFAWIFFRANNLRDAIYIFRNIFNFNDMAPADTSLFTPGLDPKEFTLALASAAVLLLIDILSRKRDLFCCLVKRKLPIRWAVYIAAILCIIIFGSYGIGYDAADFIYFQF
ncbi:MAG: MBOAT family protein [Clostridiales bacterium]|jgi:D-alanyl-lipoteichoic acid acyltransferase DltB (MBOAT superfamily)|nr:MBOAT family protein [Clostridiales bacterium]